MELEQKVGRLCRQRAAKSLKVETIPCPTCKDCMMYNSGKNIKQHYKAKRIDWAQGISDDRWAYEEDWQIIHSLLTSAALPTAGRRSMVS